MMDYAQYIQLMSKRFGLNESICSAIDTGVQRLEHWVISDFAFMVKENQIRDVEFLLRTGQDINEDTRCKGRNALHIAAQLGLKDMSALLIHYGINVDFQDNEGFTPLHVACMCRHKDVVLLLLRKGANIHKISKFGTPIVAGSAIPDVSETKQSVDIAKILLDHGANINDLSEVAGTALGQAVMNKNLHLVKFLVEAKASVNMEIFFKVKDIEETIPIISYGIKHGMLEIVKCLLAVDSSRLDVKKLKEKNMRTPLHWACMYGYLDIVKLLVEKKFNINAMTTGGKTPLLFAVDCEHFHVAEYLLDQEEIKVDLPYLGRLLSFAKEAASHVPPSKRKLAEKVVNTIMEKTSAEWDEKIASIKSTVGVENVRTMKVTMIFDDKINGVSKEPKKNNDSDSSDKGTNNINSPVKETNEADSSLKGTNDIDSSVNEPLGSKNRMMNFSDNGVNLPKGNQQKNEVQRDKVHLENIAKENSDAPTEIIEITNAIDTGDLKIVKKALDNGAELGTEAVMYNQTLAKETNNKTEFAERKKIDELLRLCLKLMKNVRSNKYHAVKDNIKQGACVNVSHSKYGSPLIYASWKRYEYIVDLLLENGANVNFQSATGSSALHMVCRFHKDEKIMYKLLEYGAFYNMLDRKNKKTPLQYAVLSENVAAMTILPIIEDVFEDMRKRPYTGMFEFREPHQWLNTLKTFKPFLKRVKNNAGQTIEDVGRAGSPS